MHRLHIMENPARWCCFAGSFASGEPTQNSEDPKKLPVLRSQHVGKGDIITILARDNRYRGSANCDGAGFGFAHRKGVAGCGAALSSASRDMQPSLCPLFLSGATFLRRVWIFRHERGGSVDHYAFNRQRARSSPAHKHRSAAWPSAPLLSAFQKQDVHPCPDDFPS